MSTPQSQGTLAMTTDTRPLDDTQRDVLREVANIGAGHAATALSLMTERKIMISVPRMYASPLDMVMSAIVVPDEILAVVPMSMQGSLDGHTILVFPSMTAARLVSIMLRQEELSHPGICSPLESSALTEAGNILAGAYMGALSDFMRMNLLPSPPSLVVGPARDVLTNVLNGVLADSAQANAYVFCVETQFLLDEMGDSLPAYFLLLPNAVSLHAILNAVAERRSMATDHCGS